MSRKELKNLQIVIAHPETTEQVSALKALKIKFETSEGNYNPDFVQKILESKAEIKGGKTKPIKKENLKEFLGL